MDDEKVRTVESADFVRYAEFLATEASQVVDECDDTCPLEVGAEYRQRVKFLQRILNKERIMAVHVAENTEESLSLRNEVPESSAMVRIGIDAPVAHGFDDAVDVFFGLLGVDADIIVHV